VEGGEWISAMLGAKNLAENVGSIARKKQGGSDAQAGACRGGGVVRVFMRLKRKDKLSERLFTNHYHRQHIFCPRNWKNHGISERRGVLNPEKNGTGRRRSPLTKRNRARVSGKRGPCPCEGNKIGEEEKGGESSLHHIGVHGRSGGEEGIKPHLEGQKISLDH